MAISSEMIIRIAEKKVQIISKGERGYSLFGRMIDPWNNLWISIES